MTKEYSIAGQAKANLGGLNLFKELADKSRDSSKAEKKIPIVISSIFDKCPDIVITSITSKPYIL
jgi:hypothetical protein